jgi:hypothetical protein
MRFGLMQTMVGIISVISNYEVRVPQNTPVPLMFDTEELCYQLLVKYGFG